MAAGTDQEENGCKFERTFIWKRLGKNVPWLF